ncbi:MAG: hypothetical protein HYX68_16955 [Planctomycetes bacterium]|nr:hypothetical protein [Planctomycetota bacterium]
MADFADFVLDSLREVPEVAAKGWRLRTHPVLGDPDMSELRLRYESGWAALAAGVLVAATRGKPNSEVWATAAWTNGIRAVDGIPVKLALAAAFGVKTLFVPTSATAAAQRSHASVELVGLPENESFPPTALRQYLRILNVPPGSDDSRADREQWYLTQWEEDLVEQFYRDHLLDEVVLHCCETLKNGNFLSDCSHLITIASKNPELVAIAVGSLRPTRCLVLSTSDLSKQRDDAMMLSRRIAERQGWRLDVDGKEFGGISEMLGSVGDVVRDFSANARAENVFYDLTPGTKEMSFALLFDVAQPGQRLFYLRQRWHGKRVQPFSIQPRVLIAGGGLSFRLD